MVRRPVETRWFKMARERQLEGVTGSGQGLRLGTKPKEIIIVVNFGMRGRGIKEAGGSCEGGNGEREAEREGGREAEREGREGRRVGRKETEGER